MYPFQAASGANEAFDLRGHMGQARISRLHVSHLKIIAQENGVRLAFEVCRL